MSSEQSASPVAHKSVYERTTCFPGSEFRERLYIRYSVNSCIRQVLYRDPCVCTGQMNTRCNMRARGWTSGSTEMRSKTHIRLNTVERCVRTPGLSLLSVQQIRRDHRAKMGGNHCLSTALVLLTLTGRQNKRYVVFAILKHDPLPYFSQRAA